VIRLLVASVRAVFVLTLLTGGLYPLAVLGVGRVFFPHAARGSPVLADGQLRGSALIGQAFTRPEYFHGRPSVSQYDARSSGGTNLSPVGSAARTRHAEERARLASENPDAADPPPRELVATSASGLDPDVSPEAAHWQAGRVAKARGVEASRVHALIDEPALLEPRTLGILGEPRMNVLRLNLELDRRFPVVR
jgi:K+-transporting ATPase ATPase C chain